MAEYIERRPLFDALYDADAITVKGINIFRNFPTADVRPVVRGKWVDEPIKGIWYHCSVCQGRFDYAWHFCPNCGAKMEGS